MFKKILVPVDSSDESRTIVRWALGLARSMGSELTLLSVVDPEDIEIVDATTRPARIGSEVQQPSDVIDKVVKKVKSDLESEVAGLKSTGVNIHVRVVPGSPAESIVAEASLLGVDLIAMSTRRESALARGILGSVTDRVLHSTSTPLLILQPEDIEDDEKVGSGYLRHIVVPLDGSSLSEMAVAPANAIATATGAEIIFTGVVRVPVYGIDMGGVGYGPVHYAEQLDTELLEKKMADYLQQFVENAESAGVTARSSVRVGNPSIQIVEEAAAADGTIIVMATRGAGGIKRWVVGSVTDKTVRSAHRPVLVIPPAAK
ncbi:MAG: universal stress protein [Chloroflexi bacterium]|nr:universal stress protein [Chloroflexota bacterium]